MTRKECLDEAAKCVLQDRSSSYGEPEDSFGVIANFWSVYLGRKVYPHDVAMMMALLKIARIKGNHGYADGYIDLAGYAACGAECAKKAPIEEPKFKEGETEYAPGDKVQANLYGRWIDCVVEKVEEGYCCIRRSNGEEMTAPKKLIRKAQAEDSEKPKFKHGDRVQYRVELPSVSDWIWRDATYLRRAFSWQQDGEHIVTDEELGPVTVKDKDIRPAPKAEGVEELVVSPFDAPQTKEELYDRIVANNPAVFGRAHKPTGEELAEMAEEGAHG